MKKKKEKEFTKEELEEKARDLQVHIPKIIKDKQGEIIKIIIPSVLFVLLSVLEDISSQL